MLYSLFLIQSNEIIEKEPLVRIILLLKRRQIKWYSRSNGIVIFRFTLLMKKLLNQFFILKVKVFLAHRLRNFYPELLLDKGIYLLVLLIHQY